MKRKITALRTIPTPSWKGKGGLEVCRSPMKKRDTLTPSEASKTAGPQATSEGGGKSGDKFLIKEGGKTFL